MQQAAFEALFERTVHSCRELLVVKGGEYAGTDDRLANFRRGSSLTGCTAEQVLFIYLSKHYDALATWVRDSGRGESRPRSEPIEGRIDDAINYLILLKAMVAERKPAIGGKGGVESSNPNYGGGLAR